MFSWRHFVTSSFLELGKFNFEEMIWYLSIKHNKPHFYFWFIRPSFIYYVSTQDSFQCSHVHFPIQNLILPLHYVYFHIWMSFCACKIGLWMYFLLSQFNVGGFQLYLACLPYRCKRGWIANSHHFKDKMFLNDNYK